MVFSSIWRGGLVVLAGALSGCAVPVVAGLTLNELSSATSAVSTLATGKGLGEHALDLATGEDCRFLEGLLRADRRVCEPPGSLATAGDFHGLAGLAARPGGANTANSRERAPGPIAALLADRDAGARSAAAETRPVRSARPRVTRAVPQAEERTTAVALAARR